MQRSLNKYLMIGLASMLVVLSACGGAGNKVADDGAAVFADVKGSISSQTGSSTDLEGWMLVLLKSKNGESRVAEIKRDGTYTFPAVSLEDEYTVVLLNAEYRLSAVLAIPKEGDSGGVRQYFTINETKLPRLIYKGQILQLSNLDKVKISDQTAKDSDSNGIPDGVEEAMTLVSISDQPDVSKPEIAKKQLNLANLDEDSDGITNDKDSDIDGDGLANQFDQDNDGNDTADMFDLDANGDQVLDTAQKLGDEYFNDGLEFATAQLIYLADGGFNIKFTAKVMSGITPTKISILGSEDLLDESRIIVKSASGVEEAKDIWNYQLKDDGQSQDDSENDGIYASKIKIKSGKELKKNTMVFFRIDLNGQLRDFPVLLNYVIPEDISFSYATSTRKFTKSGNPFGSSESSYVWVVSIYDADGKLVHGSPSLEATDRYYTVPSGELSSGASYTAKVYAQSLEKVPGYPLVTIESDEESL